MTRFTSFGFLLLLTVNTTFYCTGTTAHPFLITTKQTETDRNIETQMHKDKKKTHRDRETRRQTDRQTDRERHAVSVDT